MAFTASPIESSADAFLPPEDADAMNSHGKAFSWRAGMEGEAERGNKITFGFFIDIDSLEM